MIQADPHETIRHDSVLIILNNILKFVSFHPFSTRVDALCPSQQFFGNVGTLPGLKQY